MEPENEVNTSQNIIPENVEVPFNVQEFISEYKNGEYKTKFSEQEHESLKKFLEYRKFELEDFSN